MVTIARRKRNKHANEIAFHRRQELRYLAIAACFVAFLWSTTLSRGFKYNDLIQPEIEMTAAEAAVTAATATSTAAKPSPPSPPETIATIATPTPTAKARDKSKVSYKTPLAYGTKSLKEKTSELVEQALREGFRHVVTGGHHLAHNESGVGHGWKASGLDRSEIFLQTCFVPFGSKTDFSKDPLDPDTLPESIEEQVRLSVKISLQNLQTEYLDALVFHNFRAKRWGDAEIAMAWAVMEKLVEEGTIKHLGLTSIHDAGWFETFVGSVKIPPKIVQNRFHSNRGYDIDMEEVFAKHNVQVQRFWLLNGSSGFGRNNKDMAEAKGVTPAQLMLGFVMSMGSQTCLVGTTSQQHMADDVEIAKCYPSLFWGDKPTSGDGNSDSGSDSERETYAKKLGLRRPTENAPLPGWDQRKTMIQAGRPCKSTSTSTMA